MVLPKLTPEQRLAALEKAAEARRVRAEVKNRLKYSKGSLAEMRVQHLLESLPGIGKIKAQAIMEEVGIAASRRVKGLGPHQAQALIERFG